MAHTPITVHLDPGLEARLAALAQERGKPVADLAAEAIASFLDLERWHEQHIREGLAQIEAGHAVSDERVSDWLDSWGTDHELPAPK